MAKSICWNCFNHGFKKEGFICRHDFKRHPKECPEYTPKDFFDKTYSVLKYVRVRDF